MQQVSRKLLFAGVLAFGTLTAACGDKLTLVQPTTSIGVTGVTVSPQNATINVGTSITLGATVTADATTLKTVVWSSSNSAVATVDQTGKVTGITGGTVTIIATATADSKQSAAAAIVVVPVVVPIIVPPSIGINSVIQGAGGPPGTVGLPVNLSNASGQFDVTVNTSGGGLIELFLSSSCATNTISASDVAVATQQATSAQAGQVTLSFNSAQLNAANTAPRFANGNYCIKARLTNGTASVLATNTTPITLNNLNVFRGTVAFTSVTGGAVNAVSTTNGLAYNQGTMTVTLNPIVFTSASAVDKISGYFSKNGEVSGAVCAVVPCTIPFINQQVTNGAVSIAFTDTGSVAGVRSIFGYNSLPAGDTLYITAAIDALGNPISVTPTPGSPAYVIVPTSGPNGGIRIDNDVPTLAAYTVTAANGYIGAAYLFSSGTTGAATDTKAGVAGVGGLSTKYYVGAVASAAFATVNSCNIAGLTVATVGTDLANTNNTDANDAKVVVTDALGNQSCVDVASTFGPLFFFGVDKVNPTVSTTTSNVGAVTLTGYNVTKNFSFIYNDSISGFTAATPIRGTLVRNFFTTQSAADCVIGTYSATALTCSTTNITVTSNFGIPPAAGGSIEFTNGTAVVGYYTINATARDRALNSSTPSPTVTILAAFDNVAPTVGAVSQSGTVASLGTVTVTAPAADNFDLASSSGRLIYNPVGSLPTPVTFQTVAGTSFGPNFDATMVISGTASVALPNVYRGLQGVDVGNLILANRATPTATITVTDVGTNTALSAAGAIATTTAGANIQTGNTFTVTPTSGAPATSQTTTSLTARVAGTIVDPAFQSQPFAQIDFYKLTGGELVLVGSVTGVTVTDNITTGVRTYTYSATSVGLTAAATNTFYGIGRNTAGDAVITNAVTVTNP